nr:hypothetical protein [Tanacetum cinerariifolium]
MKLGDCATWDGGKTTWGGRVEAMGIVPVCVCAQEGLGRGWCVLVGKTGKGTVCPYKPTTILVHVVEATDNSPAVPEHTTLETPSNMSPENKVHFLAEKKAIHLILTGIRDDIYSTVDACQTAHEMWEAIERLQQ